MFAVVLASLLAASCAAVEVRTPVEFNASVWGPEVQKVVTVVEHLDLTGLENAALTMDDGSNVTMFFIVEPLVDLIRGSCESPHFMAGALPPMSPRQCHMLVTWGHVFVFLRLRSVWLDRLYFQEEQKPASAALDIANREGQPSIIFRVLDGARLWLTRSTVVGTADSTALSVGSAIRNNIPGKASLTNCTITRFEASQFWAGPLFSAGHLSIEKTEISDNIVSTANTAIVHAISPRSGLNVAIVDLRDVRMVNNNATFDFIRTGEGARVASDDASQPLVVHDAETNQAFEEPFDVLTYEQESALITTRSEDFVLKVQAYGWDDPQVPVQPATAAPTPPDPVRLRHGAQPRSSVSGVVGGLLGALIMAAVAAGAFVLWKRQKSKRRAVEQELYPVGGLEHSEMGSSIPAPAQPGVAASVSALAQGVGGPQYATLQ